MMKKMTIPFAAALSISIVVWVFRDLLGENAPLILFNVASLIGLPGMIIVLTIVAIISPQDGWQSMHGVAQYKYFIYIANFFFYLSFMFLIQCLLSKAKNRYRERANWL